MKYLLAAIFILILSFLGVSHPIEEAGGASLNFLSIPFREAALQTQDYATFLVNIRSIYRENQDLKARVLNLQSEKASYQDFVEEYGVLQDQFFLKNPDLVGTTIEDSTSWLEVPQPPTPTLHNSQEKLLLVSLTGNPTDTTNSTAYINAGSNKQIKQGDLLVYKNFLVARVKEAGKFSSLVELLYSPELKVPVKRFSFEALVPGKAGNEEADVSPNSSESPESDASQETPATSLQSTSPYQTEGIVTGDFGTSLKLTRVLQKEPLTEGDLLLTSGREGFFKPNYIVGRVGKIEAEPTQPLKSAQVIPLLELERLSKVFVLLSLREEGL
ncbi:hypothetical protein GF360_04210 [candidate division WWE3 bacterium]|nr:hypothetical protein [candidate division WWE3 bacterium]